MDQPPLVRSRPRWWVPAALGVVTLAVYLSRVLLTGEPYLASADTLPTRLVPISLLRSGDFNLDEFYPLTPGEPVPYFLHAHDGHVYSKFPVGGPLLLTPIFATLDLFGVRVLDRPATRDMAVAVIAAMLSALSVVIVYATFAPRGQGPALAVAAVYAFGTGVWPTCAQDLWQHTFGAPLMALALFCLERGTDRSAWLGRTGLPAGLLFLVRPANGLLVAVLAGLVGWRRPRSLVPFAAWSLPFLALTLAYNLSVSGHVFGPYQPESTNIDPLHRLAVGLPGLLVSPGRGLLVYSPVLALGLFAFCGRAEPDRWLVRCALAAMVAVQVVVYGSYAHWYGGHCYGPRFLIEVMPVCAALLWEAWPRLTATRVGQAALALTIGWSVLANGAGYVVQWGYWCNHPDVDRCPARLWDWRDSPWAVAYLGLPDECRHPVAPAAQLVARGGITCDFQAGWSFEPQGIVGLGRTAEVALDCHGRPVGVMQFTLRRDSRLGPYPQTVVAEIDGAERATLTLADDAAHPLRVPLRPEEADGPHRLTFHFSAHRRAAWSDPRPVATRVEGAEWMLRSP